MVAESFRGGGHGHTNAHASIHFPSFVKNCMVVRDSFFEPLEKHYEGRDIFAPYSRDFQLTHRISAGGSGSGSGNGNASAKGKGKGTSGGVVGVADGANGFSRAREPSLVIPSGPRVSMTPPRTPGGKSLAIGSGGRDSVAPDDMPHAPSGGKARSPGGSLLSRLFGGSLGSSKPSRSSDIKASRLSADDLTLALLQQLIQRCVLLTESTFAFFKITALNY